MRSKVRKLYRIVLLVVGILGLVGSALALMSCESAQPPTAPQVQEQVTQTAAPSTAVTDPQSVAPTTPSAEATRPYVELYKPNGDGIMCVPKGWGHPVGFEVVYKDASASMNYQAQPTVGYLKFLVQPGECQRIPPASELKLEIKCGTTIVLQIDPSYGGGPNGGGTAIAGLLISYTSEACCVEEWRELEPEITYGEWSACLPIVGASHEGPKCGKSRTKRTIIREQNSCTKVIRVKSDTTTEETQSCECPNFCENTPASSQAAQGFTLPNSGESTETAWVDANVQIPPFKLQDKDENPGGWWGWGSCIYANISGASSAKVALVKAGTQYRYYLNVSDGQQLCSYNTCTNTFGQSTWGSCQKDISHVSYFNCK